MALSVTFIIPCYNEEQNAAATVTTVQQIAQERSVDYQIVMVDDASRDRTPEILDALARENPRIVAVHNPVNLNLGGSYKRGLEFAEKEFVLMVPGDNGYGIESLRQVFDKIGAADILVPYVTNTAIRTWFRAWASRAFTSLINTMFALNIGYYNGPVVHRTALLRTITIHTNSFAYQAEALVKMLARGYSYCECPVQIQERPGGRSSALKLRNLVAIFWTLLHLLLVVGPRQKQFISRKQLRATSDS
jgi:glycosyltransferase involved in cell wall biosynthesis